jgi:hypothetical protein
VPDHGLELAGVDGPLVAVEDLLLRMKGLFVPVLGDLGLQIRQDLRHGKLRAHLSSFGAAQKPAPARRKIRRSEVDFDGLL